MNPQERKSEALEEAQRLRVKRKGLYKTFSKTDVYTDLMKFLNMTEASYTNSAKKGLGVVNGETTSLTSDQRMSLLDKADGIGIIKTYIENNLS